jgi:CheY-like chemotaxis protein
MALAVLLVDDNRINQRLGALMLQRLDCAVTCVDSGPAAIDHVARDGFDLVLMDVRMPRMDGLEAAQRIRADGATMPIIAVTASAGYDDEDAYERAGLDGLLSKPLRLDDLRRVIERVAANCT